MNNLIHFLICICVSGVIFSVFYAIFLRQDSKIKLLKFMSFFFVISLLCYISMILVKSLKFNDFYFLFSIQKSNNFVIFLEIAFSVYFTLFFVLSLLDFKKLAVPDCLLALLFTLSIALFSSVSFMLIIVPFSVLGMCYFLHFTLHIFSSRLMLGSGDVWALSSAFSLLLFCYPLEFNLIFYMLIISSILGIIYALFMRRFTLHMRIPPRIKQRFFSQKIPFIPFIFLSLLPSLLIYRI